MKAIVFVDHKEGKITKAGLEAISYAKSINADPVVVTYDALQGDGGAGNCGASEVIVAGAIKNLDGQKLTRLVVKTAEEKGASVVIAAHDHAGKMVAPRVAARMNASMISGATELPDTQNGFVVKKNVFSGKAMAFVSLTAENKVITVMPNSTGIKETGGTAAVSSTDFDGGSSTVTVKEFKPTNTEGGVPLPEAELVVSGGRGLKGPENWGMIEDLAKELGAATACSRPVADTGWRPHHEHVGQTGVAIRPNLYIAVGISGAIQHLAGVNSSKTIVVVNTDPEAPFFKSADYGIVGDAFEVVPKLIEAAKEFNANK
jgi:electron transfer flavoprotein alpha subunit